MALRLTQSEAADLTGYDRKTVQRWEGRGGAQPAADALLTLMSAAGFDDRAIYAACGLDEPKKAAAG